MAARFNVPRRVLVDGDRLVGFLLPRIGPQFLRTGRRFPEQAGEPRFAERLFLGRSSAESVGLCLPTLIERLSLCRQLAEAFDLLHGHGFVYGDLSGRNVLYSLRPGAAILLLDCESFRMDGSATTNPQMTTPGWTQVGRPSLSHFTDRAKLSTFMLRALSPGAGAALASDPSRMRGAEVIGDEHGKLPEIFRRAHGTVTAAEWMAWTAAAIERAESLEGWTARSEGRLAEDPVSAARRRPRCSLRRRAWSVVPLTSFGRTRRPLAWWRRSSGCGAVRCRPFVTSRRSRRRAWRSADRRLDSRR